MKRNIEFDEVPKGKDNVIQYLTRYCKSRDIEISFDDAYGNFGSIRNQSACAYGIECSVFNEGDDDLLLFSVFHELGHMRGIGCTNSFKCRFAAEFEAWSWAIDRYMMTFGENITDRQAKYMLDCLSSYTNDKGNFWCPMKGANDEGHPVLGVRASRPSQGRHHALDFVTARRPARQSRPPREDAARGARYPYNAD